MRTASRLITRDMEITLNRIVLHLKTTVFLKFPCFTSGSSEILFGVLLPVGYIIFDVFFPAHRVNPNYNQHRSSNNPGCSAVFVHSSVFNVSHCEQQIQIQG